MKKQGLLTDLDGTLVASHVAICLALDEAFAAVVDEVPTHAQIMTLFGLPVEHMLTTLTDVSSEDTRTIQRFLACYKEAYPKQIRRARLLPTVRETLRTLQKQGIPICLITNERRSNARCSLETFGILPYFADIVSRDDVRRFKPDPEPILCAARKLAIPPNACLYVGESPFDIQAGVAAGITTAAIPSGSWSRQSLLACKPDLLIERYCEMLPFFTS